MKHQLHIRSFISTYHDDWKDEGFHQNDTLEITVMLEGQGIFEWRERKYFTEAGQVILVPPYLPHRYEGMKKNRCALLHLRNLPPRIVETIKDFVQNDFPTMTILSLLDLERFERLFREFLRIISSPLKTPAKSYEAWVEVILLFLIEHSQKNQQALSVTRAADYIRENLQHAIKISHLAELSGLTEAGFRRLFYEVYKMSPKRYQQLCRTTEAKFLLSSSNKEVREIANRIGFERLHSFSQWFKDLEGISPSEWRKQRSVSFRK